MNECEHELISIKNEVIDSGFMCVYCGKLFKEYTGTPLKKPAIKLAYYDSDHGGRSG